MTEQEIRDWLDNNLEAKMAEFGLPHWRVTTREQRFEANTDGFVPMMSMTARFEYERASLAFDMRTCVNEIENAGHLSEFVEHEIMHVVHSPLDLILNNLWGGLTQEQQIVCSESARMAREMIVLNMERMTHCLRETLAAKHQAQFAEVCAERDALKLRVAELEKWEPKGLRAPQSTIADALNGHKDKVTV